MRKKVTIELVSPDEEMPAEDQSLMLVYNFPGDPAGEWAWDQGYVEGDDWYSSEGVLVEAPTLWGVFPDKVED